MFRLAAAASTRRQGVGTSSSTSWGNGMDLSLMWHHDLDLTLAIRLFGSSLASDPAGLSPSRERVAPFFRLGEFVFFRESCQVSPSPPGAKRRRLHRTWAPRGSFPDAATRALRQRLIGIPGGEHNKVAPERESTGQSADAPSTVKALR